MNIKTLNNMFSNHHYPVPSVSHFVMLSVIMLLGHITSSCSSPDELDPKGDSTGNHSTDIPTSNIGIALNNVEANLLETTVESFMRGASSDASSSTQDQEDRQRNEALISPYAPVGEGNLSCDVSWAASRSMRGPDTGYNLQWGDIGTATSIAIQPRTYVATSYSTYTVTTAGKISATSPYYFETASNDVITSWYPYNSGALASFTVQTDQSSKENYIASDLLYTSQKVNAASQSLTYSHKMAQIIVDVTVSNANYLLNAEVQKLTIAGLKTKCTTDFTYTSNTVKAPTFTTDNGTTGTITAYRYSHNEASTTSTATFIMCVPAQTIATSQVFSVTVGGTTYTGKLPNAQNLQSGYAYNISVSIGNGGVLLYSGTSIAVGDYYCRTGVNNLGLVVKKENLTSAKNAGATPIAVIFSTTTSSTDLKAGYSHGYALSLKFAKQNVQWATSTTLTESFSATINTNGTETKSNKEGRTETLAMNNSQHPAAQAALTYSQARPTTASVWFLPSCGQFFDVILNLCGMSESNATSGQYGYSWSGFCEQGITNINSYLSAAGGDTYDINRNTECTTYNQTWSSSYKTAAEAYNLTFQKGGGTLWIESSGADNYKTLKEDVRPAIAF